MNQTYEKFFKEKEFTQALINPIQRNNHFNKNSRINPNSQHSSIKGSFL